MQKLALILATFIVSMVTMVQEGQVGPKEKDETKKILVAGVYSSSNDTNSCFINREFSSKGYNS
jgi:hypothetical protein